MIFNTVATLASLAFVTVDAAPAITARADAGSIKDCTDVKLNGAWLIGTCPADDGRKVESTVWLGTKINNTDATLKWAARGYYVDSCSSCKLIDGSSLNCQCELTGGKTKNTTLDLTEQIHNYNGHLLSNVSGTPSVPADSSVAVPTDFTYSITTANSGCYSLDPKTDAAFCGQGIVESTCSDHSPSYSSTVGRPLGCFNYNLPLSSTPVYAEYEKLMAKSASNGWEFLAYDNPECSGTPFATLEPAEKDTCKKFSRTIRGLSTKPLWNAQL